MKKTCIFQDTEKTENTIDLLDVATRLYGHGQFESHAILVKGSPHLLQGAFHHIVRVPKSRVNPYDPRGMTAVLEHLHQKINFDSILIPATRFGKMLAPRLAKRLGTGLAEGVTKIEKDNDRIEIIRPAFSGKTFQVIHPGVKRPVLMSIKPNAFAHASPLNLQTDLSEFIDPVKSGSTLKRLHVEEHNQTYDIRDSDVLISGGGGVKDSFSELYRLARTLKGTVSASRKLVDQGIADRGIQVGQTGKTVSPRLYMALGIHGSMQHIAGLQRIESIISVNTSRNAPICSLSDIVVEGDAREFINRLMEKISKYRSEKKRS